jgi:dipeptidyl aminopeptidase/acylaminoacyl peptidase
MSQKRSLRLILIIVFFSVCVCYLPAQTEAKKVLTFQDIMKFKEIRNPVLSEDGQIIAYCTQQGRGDGEAVVHHLKTGKTFTVDRGSGPKISKNSQWVVLFVQPKAVDKAKAKKDKPKQGMALLNTQSGEVLHFSEVQRFALSEDGNWLAFLHYKEKKKPAKSLNDKAEKEAEDKAEEKKDIKKREVGSKLVLRQLATGDKITIDFVLDFSFNTQSSFLALTTGCQEGIENGLYCIDLKDKNMARFPVTKYKDAVFGTQAWSKKGSHLAFLLASKEDSGFKEELFSLWIWDGSSKKRKQLVGLDGVPEDWMIPGKNSMLDWDESGKRLFLGLKPMDMLVKKESSSKGEDETIDLFDQEQILSKRGVDVWHWNDPFINPHQKINWSRLKGQTYLAAKDIRKGSLVQLADKAMPLVRTNKNMYMALGLSDVPYRKEVTWDGRYSDVYTVDLKTGFRKKVMSHLGGVPNLSPGGKYILYYKDKHWHLYDIGSGERTNLTGSMDVPFFNEDYDYPATVPGYGLGGWIKDDRAVLIYDKYDIWKFDTKTGHSVNLTDGFGRKSQRTFRILKTDTESQFFEMKQHLLLSSYHNIEKQFGFYVADISKTGVRLLLEDKKKFRFLSKAKNADVVMFTRECFQEFPDLWVSDLWLKEPKKISDINPQIQDFAWGKPELVEWNSLDGIPLQGVLIKPANYEPGKRYPVIVYFYRFFSQRMYEFNQMVVNHRPNFPFYTSNGYAVFLPDIRFEVGHPGFAATKCLVPGVQKLIDMGVADPKAIGIHGHSWSGYQAAFIVTQTDLFACCIAGAPVSNMTSAYGGVRWGSGMSRQFQYEKSQSRIGGSLWEYPELYIENSPVFFADRIRTPMLIMFGDKDGAVPWYQGIELYMAMRRLGKDCIFLQYRGEPHHPQKYANKLDYSIRMKEYFDHYLKGKPGPDWITNGIHYMGK